MKDFDDWIWIIGNEGEKLCEIRPGMIRFPPHAQMTIEVLRYFIECHRIMFIPNCRVFDKTISIKAQQTP